MLTGASHTTAVTTKEKKKKKKFLLFVDTAAVPEAATSDFQTPAQSGVRGAAVRWTLIFDQRESHHVSHFEKWDIIMKPARWEPEEKARLRSGGPAQTPEDVGSKLGASFCFTGTQPCCLPPSLPRQRWGAFHTDEPAGRASGPWLSARIVALPEREAITGHASPV